MTPECIIHDNDMRFLGNISCCLTQSSLENLNSYVEIQTKREKEKPKKVAQGS